MRMHARIERLQDRRSVPISSSICALLDDQRRRHGDDVAGGADQDAVLEGLDEGREGPLGRRAGDGLELDRADQPDVADVDDMRQRP